MMVWKCIGALSVANNLTAFSTPIFLSGESEVIHAQSVDENGNIKNMFPIPAGYLNTMKRLPCEKELITSIGDQEIFGFLIEPDCSFFGSGQDLEEFLLRNIEVIKQSPVTYLSAVRFLGLGVEDEIHAICEVGNLINNRDVRESFISFEQFCVEKSEQTKNIENLIEQLSESGNFATTHTIVEKLMRLQESFESRHFKQALRACLSNNQVHWIAGDADVKLFVNFLINNGRLKLTEAARSALFG
ncbi:hypothetical protein GOB83_11895 [Acetobacter fabarum]|uniref:hypothetical protein n=3 Tax=Acetobacter fabarum TaxID=483199 RepID=UPI001404DC48|nr:hypothetical protein [Acetobacter fabarum]NHO42873.1 hypothetical protein [Acetobacter fabarum]